MGAWGTAIFSDDLAADIRGDWRELILDGAEADDATERILESYGQAREDPDDAVIFWVALAASQLETGRLQDVVRDRALEVIDAGGDVARWEEEDPAAARRRERSLDALATKLRGPQPKPKKLRRAKPLGVEFNLGDVIHVKPAGSAQQCLAVVVDQADSHPRGATFPVVELLAWDWTRPVPSPEELGRIPAMLARSDFRKEPHPVMHVVTTHRKDQIFGPHLGEIVASGIKRAPSGDYRKGAATAEVGTSYSSWNSIASYVAHEAFARDLALTWEVLAKKTSPRSRLRPRRPQVP